jgi:phosphoenolpyruvate synthase/pyruvate phosphate dikinase
MANLGLPVPPGFTISTEVCTYFYANQKSYPKELEGQVKDALVAVARIAGRTFGDPNDPLLVSVRSGARASMPGMMDTVLNLGLNDVTVEGLAKTSATGASPMTAIGASSRCTPTWCSASATTTSRRCSRPTRTRTATRSTPSFPPTTGPR